MRGNKVKCTLIQAMRICTGRTDHSGSTVIALLFLDHGTRRRWGVSVTPRPLFTPGEDPVPIVQEAGWAPGSVWTREENIASTGIRSPDRPARSQSLYRLGYPGPHAWEGLPLHGLPWNFVLETLMKIRRYKFIVCLKSGENIFRITINAHVSFTVANEIRSS